MTLVQRREEQAEATRVSALLRGGPDRAADRLELPQDRHGRSLLKVELLREFLQRESRMARGYMWREAR